MHNETYNRGRSLMKINVTKTNQTEDRVGHGVLFYFEKLGREKRIAVAFIEDYKWLHEKPESVDVLLFEIEPARALQTGLTTDEIVDEVLDFVKEFLESKGETLKRGYITTWWNA